MTESGQSTSALDAATPTWAGTAPLPVKQITLGTHRSQHAILATHRSRQAKLAAHRLRQATLATYWPRQATLATHWPRQAKHWLLIGPCRPLIGPCRPLIGPCRPLTGPCRPLPLQATHRPSASDTSAIGPTHRPSASDTSAIGFRHIGPTHRPLQATLATHRSRQPTRGDGRQSAAC